VGVVNITAEIANFLAEGIRNYLTTSGDFGRFDGAGLVIGDRDCRAIGCNIAFADFFSTVATFEIFRESKPVFNRI
jgi:hypothetical protein